MFIKAQAMVLLRLSKRNIKLYFKDKAAVFFSLLAPLIILMLFALFLGRLQTDSLRDGFADVDPKLLSAIVNGWMISGVLSVGAITISLSCLSVMVMDSENKINYDFIAAPVKNRVIYASYFLGAFVAGTIMTLAILAVGLLYLVASGTFMLSFFDVLKIILNVILSCLSASVVMMFIVSLLKRMTQFGGLSGVISAVLGFFIGAYMPVGTFPKVIQYISLILPGSYSAGIFRSAFISEALNRLSVTAGDAGSAYLSEFYGLKIDFFGAKIGEAAMLIVLSVSSAVLIAAAFFVFGKAKKGKLNP